MVSPVPGPRGPAGALLVGSRIGAGGDFTADELRLFETLSHHVGASLGRDRLGEQVQELREIQLHLEHQAFHDALTGLANRLLFSDRVRHALSRREGNAAVLYLDLDDFKPINDTLGHDAGDELLREAANRIRASLRNADTPARLGGDEFAVLLVDIEPDDALIVANRILEALVRPFTLAGREVAVGASIGLAIAPSGTIAADELVHRADLAMYVSKHGGKQRVNVYGDRAVPVERVA
jgi:diguanylate cyclase (GGDEF)-like protein